VGHVKTPMRHIGIEALHRRPRRIKQTAVGDYVRRAGVSNADWFVNE
jgi:hypothetical protein